MSCANPVIHALLYTFQSLVVVSVLQMQPAQGLACIMRRRQHSSGQNICWFKDYSGAAGDEKENA